MHPYLSPLVSLFESHADPTQAAGMTKYLRDQFPSLGIKTPERRELLKKFYSEQGLPPIAELDAILRDLWTLPQREFQYVAIGLLGRMAEELPPDFIKTIEHLIINKSWWDTVDSLAGEIVSAHFKRYPKIREQYLAKWRESDNFWLRRTCILFQLGYKEETDFPLLCDIIRDNLGSKEFFINKAIGWALRQYARTDPQAVKNFVKATDLDPLSRREALKHFK